MLDSIVTYVYMIEFQKRRLSPTHFLLTFKLSFKINKLVQVDEIVPCEILDQNKYPHLQVIVIKHKGVVFMYI